MEVERIAGLRGTALFGCLTDGELAEIAQQALELHFKKGELLFLAREEAKGIFVVVSGQVRLFQHNADGRELVILLAAAGSVIGDAPVFDGGPYPASAVSEQDAKVLFIAKRDMQQFCLKYPTLALKALQLMALRVRSHAELVEALSFHDVSHRLASFLVVEAQHTACPGEGQIAFRLLLSNHEIASRIGSVRDVVARAFARLKHDGLIKTQGRLLIIPNVDALKLYAASGERAGTTRHLSG
jgi:CRP-like cAMP-binding protein